MTTGKVVHVRGELPWDVYVGRAMPRYGLEESMFANPYRIGERLSREEALRLYEKHLRDILTRHPEGLFAKEVRDLRGKTLACWCTKKREALTLEDPEVCHGQVLLRLADQGRPPRSPLMKGVFD